MVQLQEIVNNQSCNAPEVRDQVRYSEAGGADQESLSSNPTSREREVVRKGIERMEKQISQLISIFISQEKVDIKLFKKM